MATLYALRGPDKGCTFQTDDEHVVIGRLSDQVQLTDDSISRQHAELHRANGSWTIADHNSSNGTFLNGRRIFGPTKLEDGDQIKIGASILVFSRHASVERVNGPQKIRDLVDIDSEPAPGGSAILSAIAASDESVILQPPETADQVAASNVMYQLAEMMGTSGEIDAFLERLADIVFAHMTVDCLVVLMPDAATGQMAPRAVRYRTRQRGNRPRINTSQTIINHVLTRKEGILCANAMTDDRFAVDGNQDSIHRLGLRSVICVPIIAHDEVLGALHIDCSMSHHTYTQEQLRLAIAIGRMSGLVIENARLLEERVRHERLAATGEAVAHLSHEIRNILQGLRSGADVVENGLSRDRVPMIRTGWGIIKRGIDRAVVLATNMLTFSKDRAPRRQLTQLNEVVAEVIADAQATADEKSVMLLTELDDLPAISTDPDGVQQVIGNLVRNAIEAVEAGSGRINLHTRYDADAAAVVVTVTDNGPGVDAARRDHIFEPFYSTKGHAGTGLGLAAARKIVQELQGRIDVNGQVGEGATFRVTLPDLERSHSDSQRTHGDALV